MPEDPWSSLATPESVESLSVQRVRATAPWDFFWAKNVEQSCMLILRHATESTPRSPFPQLKGIHIETDIDRGSGSSVLMFKLLDAKQRDLFHHLALDIAASSDAAESEMAAITSALNRTWRWHHMLRDGSDGMLSPEEQRGLIGELLVLRDIFLMAMPVGKAVTAWKGPFGGPKDFAIGGICVEVKTRRSGVASTVIVSSEHQLDTVGLDWLFLYVVELTDTASVSAPGFTLNELAATIREAISDSDRGAVDLFEAAISAAGYRWEDDYSSWRWTQGSPKLFSVSDKFPRISASGLSSGISHVRFSISLSACEPFSTNLPTLLDKLERETKDA